LRMSHSHGELFQMFERGFNALSERYAGLLRRAVDHRAVVLGGTLAVVALSVVVFLVFPPTRLQNELIPDDDRGFFLVVVRGPEGASLPYTDGYVRQVEQIIGRTPGVNGYFTIVGGFAGGVNSANPPRIVKYPFTPGVRPMICTSRSSAGSRVASTARSWA